MNEEEVREKFNYLYENIEYENNYTVSRPLLAHYTTMDTVHSILQSEEIWFSNPLLMNDYEEVRFGILKGYEIVNGSSEIAQSFNDDGRRSEFIHAFNYYYHEFGEKQAFDTYVFCLSEHDPTNYDGTLSMWRGYGGNGNGAAIVIDTSRVQEYEPSPIIIGKVRYASERDRIKWLDDLVFRFSNTLRETKIPAGKLYIAAHALFYRIMLFALFTKHCGFEEEREWRFVYVPERDKNKLLKTMFSYVITTRGAEPKLKFKVKNIEGVSAGDLALSQLVERIILGPSLSTEISKKSVERMLELLNKTNLIEHTHASTIPYRTK